MSGTLLRLFVYGTLKRGFENHQKLCRGVRSIEEAAIRGRLYELPAGYPGLVVPEQSILARATEDPLADLAVQEQLNEMDLHARPALAAEKGHWPWVYGELFTFDDPARILPMIDGYEGFRADQTSLYVRVIALVRPQTSRSPVAAWLYVMKDPGPRARLLPEGRWPS